MMLTLSGRLQPRCQKWRRRTSHPRRHLLHRRTTRELQELHRFRTCSPCDARVRLPSLLLTAHPARPTVIREQQPVFIPGRLCRRSRRFFSRNIRGAVRTTPHPFVLLGSSDISNAPHIFVVSIFRDNTYRNHNKIRQAENCFLRAWQYPSESHHDISCHHFVWRLSRNGSGLSGGGSASAHVAKTRVRAPACGEMHVTTGLVGDHHAAEMNANGVATVNVRPDWLSRTRITATSGGSASRAFFSAS